MRDDCIVPAINSRAKHFIRKRRVADAFQRAGRFEMAQHLRDCQEMNRQVICTNCGNVHYVEDKCKQRTCPLCSFRESRRRGDWIERLCSSMKFPKLLTLTMPRWRGIPGEGIDTLRERWNRFREMPVMRTCKGGCYQIELKPKKDGWHIHLHAILDAPFLPYQHIFRDWCSVNGAEFLSVDIRAGDTPEAQHYISKYAAKAADYEGEIDQVVQWYDATKGKRLFAGFGEWYNREPAADTHDESWNSHPYTCPCCGGVETIIGGECVRWVVGRDAAPEFEKALSCAGPPKVSRW